MFLVIHATFCILSKQGSIRGSKTSRAPKRRSALVRADSERTATGKGHCRDSCDLVREDESYEGLFSQAGSLTGPLCLVLTDSLAKAAGTRSWETRLRVRGQARQTNVSW